MTKLLLAAALVATATPALAASITLNTVIRDFSDAHPDFQEGSTGLVTGIVLPTLGLDGDPDFAGPNGKGLIDNATTFEQFYDDVAGINTAYNVPLTFAEAVPGSGIYSFSNGSFFPLDVLTPSAAFEGRVHNYHFTLELSTTFTYQTGQMFSFTGDDDLFVFINDQLVIDLGGVHGALSQSVNLDTLGLTVGQDYSFDLFFAERQTSLSSFAVQTSIVFAPNPTPAPAALGLMGLGLLGLGLARRAR